MMILYPISLTLGPDSDVIPIILKGIKNTRRIGNSSITDTRASADEGARDEARV